MNKIINLKNLILFSIFYFLFSAFTSLNLAQADLTPLVPCGPESTIKSSCDFCDLLTLVEKIINFALYGIAIPLTVIFVIYGGFVILTAGDKLDRVTNGRKIIQSTVIGILIALGAWLIINEILSAIGGGNFTPWKFNGKYSICGR